MGDDLFRVHGHWDKVLYIAPAAGGKDEVLLDIENAPVAPKRVLPTSLQGPWESRRLWQFTAAQLNTRPAVAWDEVDREKAQLEKEQRLLPCHAFKHGHDGFVEWSTKKFHLKTVHNPLTNEDVELYMFDDMLTLEKAAAGGEALNVLELSRTLPDIRGGLNGAGTLRHLTACTALANARVRSHCLRAVVWGAAAATFFFSLCRCCDGARGGHEVGDRELQARRVGLGKVLITSVPGGARVPAAVARLRDLVPASASTHTSYRE